MQNDYIKPISTQRPPFYLREYSNMNLFLNTLCGKACSGSFNNMNSLPLVRWVRWEGELNEGEVGGERSFPLQGGGVAPYKGVAPGETRPCTGEIY